MTDTKISELTAATTIANGDLIPIVSDPTGSPITKKITYGNFFANVVSNTKFSNTVTFANTTTFSRAITVANTITYSDNTVQNTAFTYSSASFSPQFSTNTGNVVSLGTQTGNYTKIGKLCYFRAFIQFGNSSYADGSGQYQIVLPFPSVATISIRGGTLHNTNTASIYHIGGVLDVTTNTTVMPLYYTGSTTDLAWKNTTPVGWQTGNTTHFDISGVYETT
jgi:hypothetical protein